MKKLILLSMMFVVALAVSAFAVTSNPSPASPGYTPMVIPIMGTYSSTQTVVKFKAPNGYKLQHASVTARAVAGTSPTLTVDILNGATSLLSTPVSVAAGTITDAVLTTSPLISDEGTVNINFARGGSYSSGQGWKDITLMLLLKRR